MREDSKYTSVLYKLCICFLCVCVCKAAIITLQAPSMYILNICGGYRALLFLPATQIPLCNWMCVFQSWSYCDSIKYIICHRYISPVCMNTIRASQSLNGDINVTHSIWCQGIKRGHDSYNHHLSFFLLCFA